MTFPRSPVGLTDALDQLPGSRESREVARSTGHGVPTPRDPRDAALPVAERCGLCNVLLGAWQRVHFAKAGDAKPCVGSWPGKGGGR